MTQLPPTPTPAGSPIAKRARQRVPLYALVLTSVGALLLGVLIGQSGGHADPTASTQFTELQSAYDAKLAEFASLTTTPTATPGPTAAETAAEGAKVRAAAKAEAYERVKAKVAVKAKAAKAAKAAHRLQAAKKAIAARKARMQARADAAAAAAAANQAAPPSNVYYANCDAARAAGAAPVYAGDPGYAPHLDRDGDGIGCE